jgi:hypothetical protein
MTDQPTITPEFRLLHSRLTSLITDTAETAPGLSHEDAGIQNPASVADAIFADTELCVALGDHAAANDPHNAARQLEAIDLVLAHLDEYRGTGLIGLNQLSDALVRFRQAVNERFAEDIELGEAYLRYAEQFADCHTPAGVGGLIRAAVAKTGATITPGPKAAAKEPSDA